MNVGKNNQGQGRYPVMIEEVPEVLNGKFQEIENNYCHYLD